MEDIIDAFKAHLMANESVDTSFSPKQGLPCFVSLLSLDNFAANISILVRLWCNAGAICKDASAADVLPTCLAYY